MAHQLSLFDFRPRSELTPETPLAQAREAFAEHLKAGDYSRHTVYYITHDLRLLGPSLGEERPIGAIGLRDLQDFVDWLRHRRGVPCTPKSLRRRITAVKAFFRWLHEDLGVLPMNPAERLVYPEAVEPLPEVLTPEQIQAAREAAEGFRQEGDARPLTLLTLMLHTGLKKSEVAALRRDHFDLQEPAVWIRYAQPPSCSSLTPRTSSPLDLGEAQLPAQGFRIHPLEEILHRARPSKGLKREMSEAGPSGHVFQHKF